MPVRRFIQLILLMVCFLPVANAQNPVNAGNNLGSSKFISYQDSAKKGLYPLIKAGKSTQQINNNTESPQTASQARFGFIQVHPGSLSNKAELGPCVLSKDLGTNYNAYLQINRPIVVSCDPLNKRITFPSGFSTTRQLDLNCNLDGNYRYLISFRVRGNYNFKYRVTYEGSSSGAIEFFISDEGSFTVVIDKIPGITNSLSFQLNSQNVYEVLSCSIEKIN